MSDFLIGQVVRVTGTFKNDAGVKADPTAVFFKYESPDGTIVEYTKSNEQLVHPSVGVYYVDINVNIHETWKWRFWATGTGQAAEEGSFTVQKSHIV